MCEAVAASLDSIPQEGVSVEERGWKGQRGVGCSGVKRAVYGKGWLSGVQPAGRQVTGQV